MNPRLAKLQKKLVQERLNGFLVSNPLNIRYLSGFWGVNPTERESFLFITQAGSYLLTSALYLEQVQKLDTGFKIVEIEREAAIDKVLADLISKTQKIGFEAQDLKFSEYKKLKRVSGQAKLVPKPAFVESFRIVKEKEELVALKKAALLVDKTFTSIKSWIRPGLTEKEVAFKIEIHIRQRCEGVSFAPIVASGTNSSLPHHTPSDKKIQPGEMVLLDFGAKFNGYCSDMTRLMFLGRPTKKQRKIYQVVALAQKKALEKIRPGMTGNQADSLARKVIEKAGFSQAFLHRLGHGLGLNIHEGPFLSQDSQEVLKENMVFSIEPAIYLPGWGGIRIEDTVVLKNGKVQVLTHSPKEIDDLIILG